MIIYSNNKPLESDKKITKPADWEKTEEYKIAVMLKVLRAMKSYGYSPWMSAELRKVGVSL